jgi:hypothetical protein
MATGARVTDGAAGVDVAATGTRLAGAMTGGCDTTTGGRTLRVDVVSVRTTVCGTRLTVAGRRMTAVDWARHTPGPLASARHTTPTTLQITRILRSSVGRTLLQRRRCAGNLK